MLNFLNGQTGSIPVFFTDKDGLPTIPTNLYFSIRKGSSLVVPEQGPISVSNTYYDIPAYTVSTTTTGKFILTYWYENRSMKTVSYRVIPEDKILPISPDQVRRLLGVSEADLPDTLIDLYETLENEMLFVPTLETEILNGSNSFSNYLVVSSALEALNALRSRVLKKATNGTDTSERFEVDFDALKESLTTRKNELKGLLGVPYPSSSNDYPIGSADRSCYLGKKLGLI